jgi:hypothetical protein
LASPWRYGGGVVANDEDKGNAKGTLSTQQESLEHKEAVKRKNWCGENKPRFSPWIITAKTTHADRPSRRPNANGRSGRTRVSTKTNRRSHDVHYARKSRKRRNHLHAARDRSIQSQEVGPTHRPVKSSLAQQTLEVIDRQH